MVNNNFDSKNEKKKKIGMVIVILKWSFVSITFNGESNDWIGFDDDCGKND